MEKTVINIATGNFDLPKEKEWIQLIQEQKKTLNLNDKLSNSGNNNLINICLITTFNMFNLVH